MHLNKRKRLDQEAIDLNYLQKLMRSLFPKNNDCASQSDLSEVLDELLQFGVRSKKELRLLMKKYRHCLLAIDKEPLDRIHQRIYREDMGDAAYLDAIRRQYWFGYPALVRIAMEKEFGEAYERYSEARDHSV
ncbi:hypothetical protein EUZ85_26525 [Hahella sp. KA22]|uniref:hypothetical protein n=1 Tax=Hahella sp. KA22 TaxID=1628392 RepID=UPI000FDDF892|nr:hypothetical protein [Hahella sp. KA22]AZZ94080.1 hypothetical protein ENC22_23940 [Hahella sp. KA22]QAY57454.1 hypothetical protein EUZ85_26525 [Hahella sp. KA22]